jgi:hypothetical protein
VMMPSRSLPTIASSEDSTMAASQLRVASSGTWPVCLRRLSVSGRSAGSGGAPSGSQGAPSEIVTVPSIAPPYSSATLMHAQHTFSVGATDGSWQDPRRGNALTPSPSPCRGRGEPGVRTEEGQAMRMAASLWSPSSSTACSRIRNFWILPVTVIGKPSTSFQ